MKIESESEVKHVENLVACINRLDLSGLKGNEAYPMFKALEALATAVNVFKRPKPVESASVVTQIEKPTRGNNGRIK